MSAFEQFSFKGWNDETVYGYVMKPFGFEPGKRYPDRVPGARRPAGELRNAGPIAGIRRRSPATATRS